MIALCYTSTMLQAQLLLHPAAVSTSCWLTPGYNNPRFKTGSNRTRSRLDLRDVAQLLLRPAAVSTGCWLTPGYNNPPIQGWQQPHEKSLGFAGCSCTWLLSPPDAGWPQVTTAPDSRLAAKAREVAWICWTFLSCSCTWLLSPPHVASPKGHNSPRFKNDGKSSASSCLDSLDVLQLRLHLDAVSATCCITPGHNLAPVVLQSKRPRSGGQFSSCATARTTSPPCNPAKLGVAVESHCRPFAVSFKPRRKCCCAAAFLQFTNGFSVRPPFSLAQHVQLAKHKTKVTPKRQSQGLLNGFESHQERTRSTIFKKPSSSSIRCTLCKPRCQSHVYRSKHLLRQNKGISSHLQGSSSRAVPAI